MKDYLRDLVRRRQTGELCGIPSYCTANPFVIEVCLDQHKRLGEAVLIEATANQVNQFGGYTGMQPANFRDMVYEIADKVGFPGDKIILGGDHLGPLTWADLDENEAMDNAKVLVESFVKAGFKKIHLDTSMKLKNDDALAPLSDDVIARRGAELYAVCEKTYQAMKAERPNENRPVYIIGSEVPIPGGAQESMDTISVTKPEALNGTINAYKKAFEDIGIGEAFENIIGIVVQPGVEFGDDKYFSYDSEKAAALTSEAKKNVGLVLEGHSTDYQIAESLKEMARDGIAILKVGPALTYALREGLFVLSYIEKELFDKIERADFPQAIESAMIADPSKWRKHYHGDNNHLALCRKYSYLDRCRYYLNLPEVEESIEKLLKNMNSVEIPMNILHQYMPIQYEAIVRGKLENTASELVKDYVRIVVKRYCYATGMISDISELHVQ